MFLTATPIRKLTTCLVANVATLVLVIALVIAFADKRATYWRWGPNPDLIVISVAIDSWGRMLLLYLIIFIIRVSAVLVEELGMPVLGFSIYNPDKQVIEDFTKNQLQFFANSMFGISGLREVFLRMVGISQIDIALFALIVSEIASFFTIRILLNEKEFPLDHKPNRLLADIETGDVEDL